MRTNGVVATTTARVRCQLRDPGSLRPRLPSRVLCFTTRSADGQRREGGGGGGEVWPVTMPLRRSRESDWAVNLSSRGEGGWSDALSTCRAPPSLPPHQRPRNRTQTRTAGGAPTPGNHRFFLLSRVSRRVAEHGGVSPREGMVLFCSAGRGRGRHQPVCRAPATIRLCPPQPSGALALTSPVDLRHPGTCNGRLWMYNCGSSCGHPQRIPAGGGGAAVSAHATRSRPRRRGAPPPRCAAAALAAAGPSREGRPLARETGGGGKRPPARSVACRIACRAHQTAATHLRRAGGHRLSSAKRVGLGW